MRHLESKFLAVAALLAVALCSTETLAQAVEFDLQSPLSRNRGQGTPVLGPALGRVSFYTTTDDGVRDKLIYSEELGYVDAPQGSAHLIVGATDADGFAEAFGLDGHPDDNLFVAPLWVVLEACNRTVRSGNTDVCDTSQNPTWIPWIANRLDHAPVASTVLSVPQSALPGEVVLQAELEAALEAERRAWEAALAAIRAAVDAERARAEAAEAALRNDLNAERAARAAAIAAEATARQTADAAIADEVVAVDARRAADALAAQQALNVEAAARATGDAASLNSAQSYADTVVSGLGNALATSGGGATVAWANITGRPSSSIELDTHVEQVIQGVDADGCGIFCEAETETVTALCPHGMALGECSSETRHRVGETFITESDDGRPGCGARYDLHAPRPGIIAVVTAACTFVR